MKNSNYYDNLFASFTNDIPLVYDFKKNCLFISEIIAKKYGLKTVYREMPYDFAIDFVSPKYRKKYCDDFNNFINTKANMRITYSGMDSSLRCDFFKVMNKDDTFAIGYSKDITNEYIERENKAFNYIIQSVQKIFFRPDANCDVGFDALRCIANYFNAGQAFIALFNDKKDLDIKYSYCCDNQTFMFNNSIYLKTLQHEYLKCDYHPHIINNINLFSDVKNFIELPLINNHGYVMGVSVFANVDTLKANYVFLDSLSNSLSLGIQNILYHEDLYYTAYYDKLTGVKNRNAYEQFVHCAKTSNLQDFGIIIVDVNGLKACNDLKGHAAGDALICKVANVLKKCFAVKDIFRFGGDEFLIVAFLKEQNIVDTISNIKNELNGDAAVGYSYSDGIMDFETMKEEADQCMYKDKSDYYKQNPTLNRRLR